MSRVAIDGNVHYFAVRSILRAIVAMFCQGSLAALDVEGKKLEKEISIVSPSGLPANSSSARFVALMLGEPA